MSLPGPIQRYHFEPILNWWHSPFKEDIKKSTASRQLSAHKNVQSKVEIILEIETV